MTSLTDRIDAAVVPRVTAIQRGLASPNRRPRTAVVLGRLLGAGFLLLFVTGLYSHHLQEPVSWLPLPTRPVWLYQLTQGLHVTVGTALLPLLLAKLWVVYPRLFEWPPVASPVQAMERLSVALLVSTAVLEPAIGLVNTVQWYPWPFPFRQTHFALSWVLVGAVLVHVAVKLPLIVRLWRRGSEQA